MIRYHLLVVTGSESGQVCILDEAEALIVGSADNLRLRVMGDGVKPSHVKITIEHGQVWLENLASTGALVNGRLIMGKTILPKGATFTLGTTSIQLKSDAPEGKRSIILPFFIVLFILGGLVVALAASQHNREFLAYTASEDDWHRVYSELEAWVKNRVENEKLNANLLELLHGAWIRDRSGDYRTALLLWQEIHKELTIEKIEGVTGGMSVATFASDNHHLLENILNAEKQQRWVEDNLPLFGASKYYTNVFWWFVNLRIEVLKKRIYGK